MNIIINNKENLKNILSYLDSLNLEYSVIKQFTYLNFKEFKEIKLLYNAQFVYFIEFKASGRICEMVRKFLIGAKIKEV